MNFEKRKRFSTAEDSLFIFLFYYLIEKNIVIDDFDREYSKFLLIDETVENYNKWIDSNCINKQIIIDWMNENKLIVEKFHKEFTVKYQPKVVIWGDREKNNYYQNMLQLAHEFECYLENIFKEKYNLNLGLYDDQEGQYNKGECELGIEIKFDMMSKNTGNLYIEYAEKTDANAKNYVNSGILKNDDSLYFLIGDQENFFIFSKKTLLEIYKREVKIHNENINNIEREVKFKIKDTSLGFIINIQTALKYTISLDELIKKLKRK